MTAREEILSRLRSQARPAPMPGVWQSRRRFADLSDQFERALTAVKGEVRRAVDLDDALDQLGDWLNELDARSVVANLEAPLDGLDLGGRFPDLRWHLVGRTEGDLRAFCAAADVGLSGAAAALAETGTVIVHSGPGRSRLATLLPPVHVVLLPAAKITVDLFTWTQAGQDDIPANLTLISGPSKTADIEQTLAIGVHGPRRFCVIVYAD